MLFSEIESLILRSSWSKLTLSFEEDSLDAGIGAECKVPRVRSSASLLEDAKGEECGSSLLGNFGEEEVYSNEIDSCWDNLGSGDEENQFWELMLRIALTSWLWFASISQIKLFDLKFPLND